MPGYLRLITSPVLLFGALALLEAVLALGNYDLLTIFAAFDRAHDGWYVDELLVGLMASALIMGVVAARWAVRLRAEITRRREAETQADTAARHDALTGLPNRRVFQESLEAALAGGDGVAVMVIDLDGFKAVNDMHGHAAGDEVLCGVVPRLRAAVGEAPLLARLGADEFAVMAEAGPAELERMAGRVVAGMAEPFRLRQRPVEIGASVGIAVGPRDDAGAAGLLRAADTAMHRAKAAGKGAFRTFEPGLDAEMRDHWELRSELREAIAAGEIVPYYQAVVDLAGHAINGFEALARWRHPTRGVLSPAVFIPMVEDMKLAGPLSLSLLRRICSDMRGWPGHLRVAMNLTPPQLQDAETVTEIGAIIAASGLAPARFEIEITETAVVSHMETAAASIAALRALGITVALDDFGTGYSSLYHLRALHFDKVKIDQSFVRRMDEDSRGADYVRAIIGLGRSLHLQVTAEGIETEAIRARLEEMGCTYGQGYLFGRPQPAEEVALELPPTAPDAAHQFLNLPALDSTSPRLAAAR